MTKLGWKPGAVIPITTSSNIQQFWVMFLFEIPFCLAYKLILKYFIQLLTKGFKNSGSLLAGLIPLAVINDYFIVHLPWKKTLTESLTFRFLLISTHISNNANCTCYLEYKNDLSNCTLSPISTLIFCI